jgi:hypothetical protein
MQGPPATDSNATPYGLKPRAFVYRAVESGTQAGLPMRRITDTQRPFRRDATHISSGPVVVEMRIYLKVN